MSEDETIHTKNGSIIYRYGDKGGLRYYVKKYSEFITEFGDIGYIDLNIKPNNQRPFVEFIDNVAKLEDNKWIKAKYKVSMFNSINYNCHNFVIEALKILKPYFNFSNIFPSNSNLALKKSKRKKLDFIPSNIKTELMKYYKKL